LPGYWVWNVAAGHEFRRERLAVNPFVTVENLADERYISSRAPLGIQPGMFRQVNAGVKFRFRAPGGAAGRLTAQRSRFVGAVDGRIVVDR